MTASRGTERRGSPQENERTEDSASEVANESIPDIDCCYRWALHQPTERASASAHAPDIDNAKAVHHTVPVPPETELDTLGPCRINQIPLEHALISKPALFERLKFHGPFHRIA